ncbi:DHH family phosphoesterase [Candidatus Bathyarchaeota archaeon]|nr:DHH family phosphoesterase [Candidatus Bathyarchaeota archaeon]
MDVQAFRVTAKQAIEKLMKYGEKEVLLIHHDDADGLCSAAIIKKALERENFKVETLCLEKAYPQVLTEIHSKKGQIIFYADIGSSHADTISELNRGRNLTIILDHHDSKPARDPEVLDLNLEKFGYKGEMDFSGATCCYLFAESLNENNSDLDYLALVGSYELPEGYKSINKLILEEAIKRGHLRRKGNSFEIVKFNLSISRLFSSLQILGAVGYYDGGPDLGITVCLEGLTLEAEDKIKTWEEKRKQVNRKLLGRLYHEHLKETSYIQWFDAGDMYKGMGTKVIGQFCSFLSYQKHLVKPNKYIVGFVNVPSFIPKWGELKGRFVKASVRVPQQMRPLIDQGLLPGAVNLIETASEGFGIADGHQYAASVVLPADRKEEFIENADKFAKSFKE